MEPTPRREGAGGEYAAAPISAESTAAHRTDRRTTPRAYRERLDNRRERLRSRARELGPGLITGAADDDPSGIASYSQAGAAFGYATLWIALVTLPLMAAVQLMCARIGIVARSGLASVLREHYPRWVLWFACTMLLVG
ncbi:MAG TPA: divalent metal cation transporter, partial [Vicinamibacterales bacterium]|nr:divalent metal cation transporter [Vicinamibacterales bacterium]